MTQHTTPDDTVVAGHNVTRILARSGAIRLTLHQPAMSAQGSLSVLDSMGIEIREREAGVKPISAS